MDRDKFSAVITAAITGVVTAVLAFCPFSGEQKAAILAATGSCGTLIAIIFVMSHTAEVKAKALRIGHVTGPVQCPHCGQMHV